MRATIRNAQPSVTDQPSATTTRVAHKTYAHESGTRPEAIGRQRLTGWVRSASRSAMSFIAYTAPARRQNTTNAEAARDSTKGANISFANTIGARTNTFFTHWCGRTVQIGRA